MQRGVSLQFNGPVIEFLLDAGGFDPSLGARPMKRTLARLAEAPLAELILSGTIGEGDSVLLSVSEGELLVRPSRSSTSTHAAE